MLFIRPRRMMDWLNIIRTKSVIYQSLLRIRHTPRICRNLLPVLRLNQLNCLTNRIAVFNSLNIGVLVVPSA